MAVFACRGLSKPSALDHPSRFFPDTQPQTGRKLPRQGLVWRSHKSHDGMRSVIYYLQHLLQDPSVYQADCHHGIVAHLCFFCLPLTDPLNTATSQGVLGWPVNLIGDEELLLLKRILAGSCRKRSWRPLTSHKTSV